jgi:hypothetical protein
MPVLHAASWQQIACPFWYVIQSSSGLQLPMLAGEDWQDWLVMVWWKHCQRVQKNKDCVLPIASRG